MTSYFNNFKSNLDKMLYKKEDSKHILQLNYAYIISCMEAYLSNAMWGTLEQYPENYNNLGKGIGNSVKLSTICSKGIPDLIKQALNNLQYHNLAQVKIHYKYAFNVNFKSDLTELLKAVNIRHDIIHRCGVSNKKVNVDINFDDINKLKLNVINFIKDIDYQLYNNFQD